MKFRTVYVDIVRRAKFFIIMEIDELMNINNRVCRSVKMNINQTKFDQFTNEFKIFRTYETKILIATIISDNLTKVFVIISEKYFAIELSIIQTN